MRVPVGTLVNAMPNANLNAHKHTKSEVWLPALIYLTSHTARFVIHIFTA